MKRTLATALIFISLLTIFSCKPNEPEPLQPPTIQLAKAGCYQIWEGLILQTNLSFPRVEWTGWVAKEEASLNLAESKIAFRYDRSGNQLVLNDTLVAENAVIAVRVKAYANTGQIIQSVPHKFKRQSGGTCITWVPK